MPGLRRRKGELIELERLQLRRNQVIIRTDMRQVAESVRRRDRKLSGVVQPMIPKSSLAVHLQSGHERVPVRYRTPAGPGMEVNAAEAERGRNERRTRHVCAGDHAIGDL